jgi:hypothetical protein
LVLVVEGVLAEAEAEAEVLALVESFMTLKHFYHRELWL